MLREDGKMMTVVIGTATTADVPVVRRLVAAVPLPEASPHRPLTLWLRSAGSATANVIMAAMAVIPGIATHTVGETVP